MRDATATRLPDPRLVPPAVQGVLRTLRGAHKQAWLAGGAVRDLLRIAQGEKVPPPQDFDVATDALPEEVQRLFPRTAPTGIAHGTVTVLADEQHDVEVTTFRGEGPYPRRQATQLGHLPGRHRGRPRPPRFHRERDRLGPDRG